MNEILTIVYVLTAALCPPALLSIWFFGMRPYIRKKGGTAITAASWGLSMWADWTVASEIGRKEGKLPFSVKAFTAIHILVLIEFIIFFTI